MDGSAVDADDAAGAIPALISALAGPHEDRLPAIRFLLQYKVGSEAIPDAAVVWCLSILQSNSQTVPLKLVPMQGNVLQSAHAACTAGVHTMLPSICRSITADQHPLDQPAALVRGCNCGRTAPGAICCCRHRRCK